MVCAGAKPSLRLASCCRVEVVNGACGLRRAGLASTVDTVKLAASIAFLKSSASAPVPMSSRWIFLPSAPTQRAPNLSPPPAVRAWPGVDALDLRAVGADQTGLERIAPRRRERRDQRPVFPGHEFLDL